MQYLTYLALVYLLVGLIVATVGPGGKEVRTEFAKLRKGTPPNFSELGLTVEPTAPLWKCLAFVVVITTFAVIMWPAFWDKLFPPKPKKMTPSIPTDWLSERTSADEAERKHSVRVDKLGPEPIPFGYQNARWRELLSTMNVGDELWNYSNSAESWKNLAGRAGIAVVRNGKIIASMTTLMN
jgi:hypothetical protein